MNKVNKSLVMALLLGLGSCAKQGCMDPEATNFSHEAKLSNESCVYGEGVFFVKRAGDVEFNGPQVVIPFEFSSALRIVELDWIITHENGYEIERLSRKVYGDGFGDMINVFFSQRIWYSLGPNESLYSYKDSPPFGNLRVELNLKDTLGNGWPYEFEVPVMDKNAPTVLFNVDNIDQSSNLKLENGWYYFDLNQPANVFRFSYSTGDDFFLKTYDLSCYKKDSLGVVKSLYNVYRDTNEYITTPLSEDDFFYGSRYYLREIVEFVPDLNECRAGDEVVFVGVSTDYFDNIKRDSLIIKIK